MRLSRFSFVAPATLAALSALAIVTAPAAHAQVTTYSTAASFNAATSTNVLYDFENIAPAGDERGSPNLSPLTVSAAGYNGDTRYYVISSGEYGSNGSLNGTDSLVAANSNNNVAGTTTLNFGRTVNAFGTEIGTRGLFSTSSAATFNIQLFSGAIAVGSAYIPAAFQTGFAGFTSTQTFDRAVVTMTQPSGLGYTTFDNVRLNVVTAAAPEPGTLPLLGMGLAGGLGVVKIARRRKRHVPESK